VAKSLDNKKVKVIKRLRVIEGMPVEPMKVTGNYYYGLLPELARVLVAATIYFHKNYRIRVERRR